MTKLLTTRSTPGHLRGLLLRSALTVVLASLLAGIAAVAYTAYATSQRAHRASETRLNELLDTVESTLSVACFAKDQHVNVRRCGTHCNVVRGAHGLAVDDNALTGKV